jgi:uncharacterized membrane protein
MTDLETPGEGWSYATGINDAGQVVGKAAGGAYSFITGPNGIGMTDLDSLVELPMIPGGINNVGQVIAHVSVIPEPESYALMLAGLILVGLMARRKRLLA